MLLNLVAVMPPMSVIGGRFKGAGIVSRVRDDPSAGAAGVVQHVALLEELRDRAGATPASTMLIAWWRSG
jgi:hypothetical protein